MLNFSWQIKSNNTQTKWISLVTMIAAVYTAVKVSKCLKKKEESTKDCKTS